MATRPGHLPALSSVLRVGARPYSVFVLAAGAAVHVSAVPVRSGGVASLENVCRARGCFPLVGLALEGGGAGGAEGHSAESVPGGVPFKAAGSHAEDAGRRFTGTNGTEGRGGPCGRGGDNTLSRGLLPGEFEVDEALEPGGAGVVAAGLVDAGEGVLRDSQLYYRTSWPVCLGLGCAQLGDLQWNAL